MAHLDDPKQEKFANLVANTNKITESFRKVFKPKGTKKSVNESASKLAAKVKPRIEELRLESKEIADKLRILTKTELLLFLSDVVRTPVGEIDEMSPLCQEVKYSDQGAKTTKMPGKIDAGKTLAAMQGWNAKEEVKLDLTASAEVAEALSVLFAKKR